MKVLVIGGAGNVGRIIRTDLERQHDCTHLDLKAVDGAESRTIVGSVTDEKLVKKTCQEGLFQAIVYLAMGTTSYGDVQQVEQAFLVNVAGAYLAMAHGFAHGVQRFVYASTLSVYQCSGRATPEKPADEHKPADDWSPYGLSKRTGEFVLQAGWQRYPDRVITALRLMLPSNQERYAEHQAHARAQGTFTGAIGPQDTSRLFLASLALDKPGCHIVQAVGHPGLGWNLARAKELLGWEPRCE